MLAPIRTTDREIEHMTESATDKRDPRPMNAMTDQTKYAHGFLLRWGEWSRSGQMRAYPPRTLLGRIMEEGPHGALSTSRPPIDEPSDDVGVVENIVKRMCEIDRKVLTEEYVEPWRMQNDKARRSGMKTSKYIRTLRRARERVYFGLAATDRFAFASEKP